MKDRKGESDSSQPTFQRVRCSLLEPPHASHLCALFVDHMPLQLPRAHTDRHSFLLFYYISLSTGFRACCERDWRRNPGFLLQQRGRRRRKNTDALVEKEEPNISQHAEIGELCENDVGTRPILALWPCDDRPHSACKRPRDVRPYCLENKLSGWQ